MAEEVLGAYPDRVSALTLVPSSGGRFIVTVNGREIYNKAETGRFPEEGEVRRRLSELL